MNVSNPLKWHGGKTYMAQQIIDLMPPHTHYVEPFFGGGAVLFAKNPEGVSEVVNDLNGGLTNFWNVLAREDQFAEFRRIVEAIPMSQELFRKAIAPQSSPMAVDRAVAFFVKYRQSRQGLGRDFATMSRNRTRRGMNEQVSSWLSAVEGLPEAHARLKRVVIFNDDACKIIKQQDGPSTLFYCDPPYLHETRVTTGDYECEMSIEQHRELLAVLADIDGKFILSGYPSALYDDLALKCGWRHVDIVIDNKASSRATKEKKIERLWMNFAGEHP